MMSKNYNRFNATQTRELEGKLCKRHCKEKLKRPSERDEDREESEWTLRLKGRAVSGQESSRIGYSKLGSGGLSMAAAS